MWGTVAYQMLRSHLSITCPKKLSWSTYFTHCLNTTDENLYNDIVLFLLTEISGVSSGCQQGGCLTCSDYNGCLSCKPRFFMHLERIGMKQIGVCMTSCPPGFYGTRSPERNTCTSKPSHDVPTWNEQPSASSQPSVKLTVPWMDGH